MLHTNDLIFFDNPYNLLVWLVAWYISARRPLPLNIRGTNCAIIVPMSRHLVFGANKETQKDITE
jgi:hypothetical protein